MTRQYYLQHQWMPFYIASLSILFYMPYIVFRIINTNMISLKTTLEKDKVNKNFLFTQSKRNTFFLFHNGFRCIFDFRIVLSSIYPKKSAFFSFRSPKRSNCVRALKREDFTVTCIFTQVN